MPPLDPRHEFARHAGHSPKRPGSGSGLGSVTLGAAGYAQRADGLVLFNGDMSINRPNNTTRTFLELIRSNRTRICIFFWLMYAYVGIKMRIQTIVGKPR